MNLLLCETDKLIVNKHVVIY